VFRRRTTWIILSRRPAATAPERYQQAQTDWPHAAFSFAWFVAERRTQGMP